MAGNPIGRLWRGEVSLVRTYWVYGAVGGLLLSAVGVALDELDLRYHSYSTSVIVLLWAALVLAWAVVIIVGTWRSATRYAAEHHERRIYAVLAKASTVLYVISLALTIGQALIEN